MKQKFKCKEGFIERLECDSGYDPNLAPKDYKKTYYNAIYYRLNGLGNWLPSGLFRNMASKLIFSDEFTADQIWNSARTGFVKL